ncbi:DUF1192 domain-containing protein [uncultured Sneathiella sp.]|jgi:uncharacterized small protein (DUF1192 family)|uniref:DUF1192 domain-containing protein n=1 Tax=uncultured Sneathiella sp. TaxID=879315 RepID=UPI0030D6F43A|tara:strand:+ start:134 stop:316 length:183 start_codon:yes stop_codon:yes gene_type:complete
MTSDEDDKPLTGTGPVNFDTMSISDLEEYIVTLKEEVERTKQVILKKKAAQDAATNVFKS